ncbi:hypothetical protein ACH4OW_28975 [Streptomyces sp. NPDC017056]|uniref:hypothetical protein n=1 Tax=Streptomyces sp. NPDC017056 TaxID=3364973 RepID=UPI00379F3C30
MVTFKSRFPKGSERTTALGEAEAGLVEHYTGLVRLAYLTLPPSLGRHRRVLVSHGLVQRALPGFRLRQYALRVPAQRPGPERHGPVWAVRERVLRAALAYERRPRWWPKTLPPPRALRPTLPVVWGLRLFPRAGDREEIALGQALSGVSADVRAAFVLCRADGLPEAHALELLTAAGASRADRVVRLARQLDAPAVEAARPLSLLRSAEFDACSVRIRPTDLLRRRHRFRLAWAVAAVVAVGAVVLTATGSAPGAKAPPTTAGAEAASPDALVRTPRNEWSGTARVDFTAWPPRGGRTGDRDLLARALATWAAPPAGARVTRTPDTATDPPLHGTRLLYAGEVDGKAVALFHDGLRAVRYSEPLSPDGSSALDFARTDNSDLTTAAALVVSRGHGTSRYLTAPWIARAQTRDLLRPGAPAQPLQVSKTGVTDPVRTPAASGPCHSWPALHLHTSPRIAEQHAFVVTDLGGLVPAHLTYTPPPGKDTTAWQPHEATGTPAQPSWARAACHLTELPDDVRTVNIWDFANQHLPENGGHAVWSCVRADTWRGLGDVSVRLTRPGAAARVVARSRSTAACSRYGRQVVASTRWRAQSGHGYLLAAGSAAVTDIEVTGAAQASAKGRTLAVRAPAGARAQVSARLAGGGKVTEIGRPAEN